VRIPACQAFWIKSRASGVFELHSNMAVGTEGAILTVSAIVAVLAALIIVMAALFMVVEMTRSRNESVPDYLIAFLREMHNSRTRLRLVLHPGAWLQYKEHSMAASRVEEWFQDLLDADHVKSESLTAKQD